jgi:death on curing protein
MIAALMLEGIAARHPLLDGNKRLGFLSAADFLDLNGLTFDAPERHAAAICIDVVALRQSVDDLAAFFRRFTE